MPSWDLTRQTGAIAMAQITVAQLQADFDAARLESQKVYAATRDRHDRAAQLEYETAVDKMFRASEALVAAQECQ
jgi:hypothetical protein